MKKEEEGKIMLDRLPRVIREGRFVALDVETTGLSNKDEIIQLALYEIEYGQPHWRKVIQFKPNVPISEGAFKVHGISSAKLVLMPKFAALVDELNFIFSTRTILVYNASLDIRFLSRQITEAGRQVVETKIIDVLRLERHFGGEGKHDLASAAQRWQVPSYPKHEALGDALTTWAIFCQMCIKVPTFGNLTLAQAQEYHDQLNNAGRRE